MSGRDARRTTAVRWLLEQHDQAFPDEQRDALARWLVSDLENCTVYLDLVRAWRRLAILKRGELPYVYGKRPERADLPPVPVDGIDPDVLAKSLGRVISQCREGSDRTQEQLAADANISRRCLSLAECGHHLSIKTLAALAPAMNGLPSELLSMAERFGTALIAPTKQPGRSQRRGSAAKSRRAVATTRRRT